MLRTPSVIPPRPAPLAHAPRLLPLAAMLALLGCPAESSPPPVVDGPPPQVDMARDTLAPDTLAPDTLVPDLPDNKPPTGAILVSPVGLDSATCGSSKQTACATIAKGIERAKAFQPPRPVALGPGNYLETVTLADGMKLLGGYNAEFEKLGGGNKTAIIRGAITGGEAVALIAENLSRETVVDTVQIEAPQPTQVGKSSYGVVINNAPRLVLRNCTIKAADGVDGVDGSGSATAAPSGKNGGNGTAGANFDIIQPQPIPSCVTETPRHGFPGAAGTAVMQGPVACGSAGGKGGQAGVDACKGLDGGTGSLVSVPATSCTANNAGAGGKGGTAGLMNTITCLGGPPGGDGHDGCDGRDSSDGADGAGGKHQVLGSYFAPTNGEDGKSGVNNGSGGGGGGGGGGGDCNALDCLGKCIADYGGGGGGGGSAGCPGTGGTGGSSGGGSFALFIVGSAATVTIEGCTLITGKGGKGGVGGVGQPGGKGGSGGTAGLGFQDSGKGGKGGKGGDGGRGGHGGGGAGGPSVAIYVASGSAPTVTQTTFQLGNPGAGGSSPKNAGEDGFQKDIHE
jgi:hypothetical protein